MINCRFDITGKLGEGRNKVFRCNDLKSDAAFAMKIMSPLAADDEKIKFSHEYHLIRRLNHPGIIKAYEYGFIAESEHEEILPGSRYILLELFEGKELSTCSGLSEQKLREILIQVLSALQYLHLSNFIYYDLKPENILIDKDETGIKVIDFGFARSAQDSTDKNTRGTAEYIAPELLKKEAYDHRADFYSLGILMYKLIYGKFPFDNSSEIRIFKAQLGENFSYPENNYSQALNNIMRRLLEKDPGQRYLNAVQIYSELSYNTSPEIISTWVPAKNFSGRKDVLSVLRNYLVNYTGGDLFVIKGSEGSGKTALLNEFSKHSEDAVLIDNAKTRFGLEFITDFVSRVFYTDAIYNCIPQDLNIRIKNFLEKPPNNITDEVKGIFSQLVRKCRFVLIVDDFNFLDELSLQVFREIIPLFQVHNFKVVLSENTDRPPLSEFIRNQHQLNLTPFTEAQVQEFLDQSFYSFFPKEDLKKLILLYADLLPGSIESFIKDLVLFGIINFTPDSIVINSEPATLDILRQSHEYFYKLRMSKLEKDELIAAEYLASFETIPDKNLLAKLLKKDAIDVDSVLLNLRGKNILHLSGNLNRISFTSAGMKNYIYQQIEDKANFHRANATILENMPGQNHRELAYQFEAAQEFGRSLDIYMLLYQASSSTDAYTYQKQLLEHVLKFPLPEEQNNFLKFELCKVLQKSGDAAAALDLCEQLLIFVSDPEQLNEVLLLKGVAMMKCGKPEEGIKEIVHLVEILEDEERKQNLSAEIASAYLDLNNFEAAEELSRQIIASASADPETRGKCWNYLGLISIHRDNDFDKAYDAFVQAEKIYSQAGLRFRTAQMQSNLGNILNIKGETQKAEELWTSSLDLNSTMGNLYHEANLQLNFGVMNFERLDYEKSIQYYKNALSIFSNTGDIKGEGLVNYNLGEIYYLSCDYKSALQCLQHARDIFQQVQDVNEELETLFLLGRVYIVLGSRDKVNNILNEFSVLVSHVPGEKHSFNHRFLKIMHNSSSLNFFHEIKDIISYYNRQGEKYNFFRASMEAVRFLNGHELYKEALEEITDSDLTLAAQENSYFNAEWNLYFGLITDKTGSYDVHPSEYYLKALNLIENLSISELTWEILTVLAQFYYERGNYLRAEEHAYYSKTLISFISENIGDSILQRTYLNKQEIKQAIAVQNKILKTDG